MVQRVSDPNSKVKWPPTYVCVYFYTIYIYIWLYLYKHTLSEINMFAPENRRKMRFPFGKVFLIQGLSYSFGECIISENVSQQDVHLFQLDHGKVSDVLNWQCFEVEGSCGLWVCPRFRQEVGKEIMLWPVMVQLWWALRGSGSTLAVLLLFRFIPFHLHSHDSHDNDWQCLNTPDAIYMVL